MYFRDICIHIWQKYVSVFIKFYRNTEWKFVFIMFLGCQTFKKGLSDDYYNFEELDSDGETNDEQTAAN